MSDLVRDYLAEYGRDESELLGGDPPVAGVFRDERELIAAAEQAYVGDRHDLFEIQAGECALLVIDMQHDFVDPDGPMCVPEAHRQLPRIERLIECCRRVGVPVVFTEVAVPDDAPGHYRALFPPVAAGAVREGASGTRVHLRIAPSVDERVLSTKFGYDAFNGTPLDYVLRQRGVRTVIVCGTLTNLCCETTARTAFGLGYHVVFGSDVNSTDNADAQRGTLRTMRRGFARVMGHRAIICALEGRDDLHHEARPGSTTGGK